MNKLPVADADKVVTLPIDSTLLDGTQSYDPDATIATHQWKYLGNSSFYCVVDSTTVQPTVTDLYEGIYTFELTVTDNGDFTDKDTLQLTVKPQVRITLGAQVIPKGSFSEARSEMAIATAGTKIIFEGGLKAFVCNPYYSIPTDRVDIYDTVSHI